MTTKTALLALAATFGGAAFVEAGYKSGSRISISTATQTASGILSHVRNSTDAVQQMGCRRNGFALSAGYVSCWARDAAGTYLSCLTHITDAGGDTHGSLRDAVSSISGDSYVQFHVNPNDGTCNWITVTNSSAWAPKEP